MPDPSPTNTGPNAPFDATTNPTGYDPNKAGYDAAWGKKQSGGLSSVFDTAQKYEGSTQQAQFEAQRQNAVAAQRGTDLYNKQMAFFAEMSKPFDPNDPTYKAIMDRATGAATNQARMSGVEGPVQVNQGLQAATLATSNLAAERKGLAASMLGGGAAQVNAGVQGQTAQTGLGYADLAQKNKQFDTNTAIGLGGTAIGAGIKGATGLAG